MTSNTVKDFLETVKPGNSGITCPACGSILGIRRQGTYDTILTENARLELDGSITNYRSFLEGIEAVLEQINIIGIKSIALNSPYQKEKKDNPSLAEGGVHKTTIGSLAVEEYINTNIDYFEWTQNFYSFVRQTNVENILKSDIEGNKDKVQKLYNRAKEVLIAGLEPRSVAGPLVDLIFEQKYVSQWMKKFSIERAGLYALLDEVCPKLQWYLTHLLQLDKALNQNPDSNLAEGVLRVQFILAIALILLGSPGTGKSSVMLTGFIAFYNNVSALGATVSFDSPDDEARMKELSREYWAGKMPSPTQQGARKSIKLAIEFAAEPYKNTSFVFTDIPGEVAARSLTEEGSDTAVLRMLKNAETIVFFFDLSIEPSIREKLTKGDDNSVWKGLEDNYNRVYASRPEALEVSQLQLLQKLVRDLQVQKGTNNLKGTKFICVIPKSDLFAKEDERESFFFTDFYKALEERQILVPSRHYRNESFAGLYSLGGIGSQVANSRGVELQKQIGKLISQEALNCLGQIGNALGDEPELTPLKQSLVDTLQVRLVAMLKRTFGDEDGVYFLPVSAQGEDSKSIELGHPPNQKLSEYVFILPIALCAEKLTEAAKESRQSSASFR